jgi:hypothetical protein
VSTMTRPAREDLTTKQQQLLDHAIDAAVANGLHLEDVLPYLTATDEDRRVVLRREGL